MVETRRLLSHISLLCEVGAWALEPREAVEMCLAFDWEDLSRTAVREARRMGLGREDAQDVGQEAVMRAWRKQHQCRDLDAAHSWVASISRREAFRLAGNRNQHPEHDALRSAGIASHAEAAELRVDLRAALRTLPALDQLVLLLRYEDDLAHADIGAIMDSPAATAATRVHRARSRLAEAVKSADGHWCKNG